jgi:hypothetical protein
MMAVLLKRRTVPLPTVWGWLLLLIIPCACLALWWFKGEPFLSCTERTPADVLVVEGWIGPDGIRAAAKEYAAGGYRYIVATSGMSGNPWSTRRWSYAEEATEQLQFMGIPRPSIVTAVPVDSEKHRTFEAAVAVLRALRERHIQANGINVFTRGSHARRSRLVFEKVFRAGPKVGVVSWLSDQYKLTPWWDSSERSLDLCKESLSYAFEVLFDSGRHAEPSKTID